VSATKDSKVRYRLPELVACAEREIALRKSVYAKKVKAKDMSQAKADEEIGKMEAIRDLLKSMDDQPDWKHLVEPFAKAGADMEKIKAAVQPFVESELTAWHLAHQICARRLSPHQWMPIIMAYND
jgi:hypothetical protein